MQHLFNSFHKNSREGGTHRCVCPLQFLLASLQAVHGIRSTACGTWHYLFGIQFSFGKSGGVYFLHKNTGITIKVYYFKTELLSISCIHPLLFFMNIEYTVYRKNPAFLQTVFALNFLQVYLVLLKSLFICKP